MGFKALCLLMILFITACGAEMPLVGSNEDGNDIPYKVETLAEGLNVPWEMDIAEKGGRVLWQKVIKWE